MSSSEAFHSFYNNNLLLHLVPVTLRSLISLRKLPCALYTNENYLFKIILKKGDKFSKEHAKNLFLKGHKQFFIHKNEYHAYTHAHQEELLKISRSLSVGDSLKKIPHQIELLNKNLELLYLNPLDDELLQQQHQSIHNLSQFLYNEKKVIKKIYNSQQISAERYLFQQPLHSSILLMGFLKYIKVFAEKNIHSLFVTSYLKDIGMSLLPPEYKDQSDLSRHQRQQLAAHAQLSETILQGRINLDLNYLTLIKNHHGLTQDTTEITMGVETILINIMDIFVAATSQRPYRDALSPFEALEIIKPLMLPQYATEFKYLVHYLKKILQS